MESNQIYLNIPEVAKLLRISRNRAYDIAASDPTFPVITIGPSFPRPPIIDGSLRLIPPVTPVARS